MTIATQCHRCIQIFKSIIPCDTDVNTLSERKPRVAVNDELDRFSLWIGNIGALHPPGSPLSLESRLEDGQDILQYASSLLDDLGEVLSEVLDLVSGHWEDITEPERLDDHHEAIPGTELNELMQEIGQCINRLFKMTNLVRQAAPTDPFAKALSRNRYSFDEKYDIAHVGEKFPKLATVEMDWLRKRLGRAITQRRSYLSYTQDHRDKLEQMLHVDKENSERDISGASHVGSVPVSKSAQPDTASRPSTYFTKATTAVLDQVTPAMLVAENGSETEDDAKSYTTISRSMGGDLDTSAATKVPKLEDLRTGPKKEVECPFCFRVKRLRNDRIWRRHVFSDLRTYVCTFPNCDSPYFGDINDWFRHEMDDHRVNYVCRLCSGKSFQTEQAYLSHIHRKHPNLLRGVGDEQIILNIARKPLDRLNPLDCPCCSDWPERLSIRATADSTGHGGSSDTIYVAPDLFKRHLASHLEQLALFAVPLPTVSAEREAESTGANGNVKTDVSNVSAQSCLTFSSPPLLPVVDLVLDTGEYDYFADMNENSIAGKNRSVGLPEQAQNSPPGSPTSSTHSRPVDGTRSTSNFADLLPPLSVAQSIVNKSTLGPVPYPAFLQPSRALEHHDKWTDLEWAQMNRLRDGMAPTDAEEPSRWARCNGEGYAARNRYMNVDPYQAQRVRLEVPEGANDYINASPIELITTRSKTRLRYIATQGPKADTWSHFWRMLWHETQSPAVVVMVTKTHEQGREKCYPYYPQSTSDPILRVNEHDEFEDGFVNDLYLIKLAHDQEAHTEVREIDMVAEDGSMSRKVWHLLFEGWPDFSVPEDINKPALLEMIKLARAKNGPDNPLIVHCSAGIGRSGTFIALDWLMRELQEGSLDKLPDDEDPIMRCIDLLRDQRPMMVQSKQQFNFIYDVLREQWRKRWIELHPEKAMHIGIRSNEEAAADESNSKRRKRCRDGDDDGYFVAN